MTVTMHDEKFTVISIQKMDEHAFNGQYLTFKGSMYRSMANAANPAVLAAMPEQDRVKLEHIPSITDVETFNELKQSAFDYLQTIA
jgi:UDP-N-acetylglucosamine enolpyruvyl transferase